LTVYVVSSSSSPSPSPPWSPGVDRESPSSSCDPSVAGVSPLEGASRNPGVDAAAGAAAGVLAVVDAGVDPVVLAPPPVPVPAPAPAAPVAETDVDVVVVDGKPKSGPEAAADVVVVANDDEPWEGDPNEKPTLPAFGGVVPSLLPGATPNPNDAGVVVDAAAPPKENGEDLEGKPNGVVGGPPNMLPGCSGGNSPAWSFFSLSSADFVVVAPNMLLEPPKEPPVVVVSPNNLEPGAMLKAKGAGVDEAGLSFSLSFSSKVDLSEPKSGPVFGGPLKSKVLVAPLPLPPKEKGADSFVVTGLS
jgi:hypothetical protein